ncbi:MAG: DEAD/DEAH box helicase [bacterium]|nr:DEAD/DEAH box helicase [bacterium]
MNTVSDNNSPLIVQGDMTVLLEVASPRFEEARDGLLPFAELVKSPEYVHTYRITPLSIWNACAAGLSPGQIVNTLNRYSRYPVPDNVLSEVRDQAGRFGVLKLERDEKRLIFSSQNDLLAEKLANEPSLRPFLGQRITNNSFRVQAVHRGLLKQALIKLGRPVHDLAGHVDGESLAIVLRDTTLGDEAFQLRDYQSDAARCFYASGTNEGGSSVVVLPCGAGKTIVGLACMQEVGASTLILTTGTTAVRQWRNEILDKTTLMADQVGEYSGHRKEILPVTVATYQVLTHRRKDDTEFTHMALFNGRDWGLIIYDEVHLLPAPVFQFTADLQARRRLGLTATLVREDGLQDDVFALIGPKSTDVPWKELEGQGWIAKANCTEIRLPMAYALSMEYACAEERYKARIAAENPDKLELVRKLLDLHPDDPALVIGTYVDQLKQLAAALDLPLITGTTGQRKRDKLYEQFRCGKIRVLIVSKVANFAVDLPDASLAIQVSGSFGSRQEEAQRLGRLLRPKSNGAQAHFYSLVTRDSKEQEFAVRRQLFLCEQGYTYQIQNAPEILERT